MPKVKYYAVRVGREGPKIYETWDECKRNTAGWPGNRHQSFTNRSDAEKFLDSPLPYNVRTEPESLSDLTAYRPVTSSRKRSNQSLSASSPEPPSSFSSKKSKDADADSKNASDMETDSIPFEKPSPAVILSPEQSAVLQNVKQGKSVFFTGSAGTGKSVLLREIIRTFGGTGSLSLAITASTGIAAVNIGGTTLHSWAGIGLGSDTPKSYAGKFIGQKKFHQVLHRWRSVKYLIIDEVSMLDGELFDKLEQIARLVRKNDWPFGGIQLVLSGDFCQLPPVAGNTASITFAFEAQSWNSCVGFPITLTKVFRQKDQAFADMLNSMRFGNLKPATIEAFKRLSRPVTYDDGIQPTELFPTRAEVASANKSRLAALPGVAVAYDARDRPGIAANGAPVTKEVQAKLLSRLIVPETIVLKVDAQVMLVKNLLQGELVNGSVGRVTRFATVNEVSKTDKNAILNADDKSGRDARNADNDRPWPMVRFTNGREMLCVPAEFTVNNASGEMEACRLQVPLIHAWALSVHKSQGQTLERVKVDLRRTFEKGQAYVALSRATNMDALQVLNFDASKVVAHPRVLAWYNQLDLMRDPHHVDDFEDEMDDDEAMAAYYD